MLLNDAIKQSPNLTNLWSRAALYNAKRGLFDEARSALERVPLQDGDVSAVEVYRAVVTYEIFTEREQALLMLNKAIEAGYPKTEILNDPELDNLRQDAEYRRIISKTGP